MKTRVLKLKTLAILLVVAVVSICLFTACEEKEDIGVNDNIVLVNETSIDNNTKLILDTLFSDENTNIRQMQGDTLFHIINDMQGLFALGLNSDVNIDLDNNCIIWGKVVTPNTSCAILSNNLYYDRLDSSYRYEVDVFISKTGYTALKNLYFWGIYSKTTQDVSFVLKLK